MALEPASMITSRPEPRGTTGRPPQAHTPGLDSELEAPKTSSAIARPAWLLRRERTIPVIGEGLAGGELLVELEGSTAIVVRAPDGRKRHAGVTTPCSLVAQRSLRAARKILAAMTEAATQDLAERAHRLLDDC